MPIIVTEFTLQPVVVILVWGEALDCRAPSMGPCNPAPSAVWVKKGTLLNWWNYSVRLFCRRLERGGETEAQSTIPWGDC